jgi:hypothetical protein
MIENKTVVYTTVYPGIEPYLASWAESVSNQTERAFDVRIGTDQIANDSVTALLGRMRNVELIRAGAAASPACIRQFALSYLIPRFDLIVFVDSDDILWPSRVAGAREALRKFDGAACAMRFVDASLKTLGRELQAAADVAERLPHTNVFGLSNTAYRSEALKLCPPIPNDCELVDWFIATHLWIGGAKLGFDPVVRMDYRQHENTMARALPPFTPQEIQAATRLVMRHYHRVLTAPAHGLRDRREAVERARNNVVEFEERIAMKPNALEDYVALLNRLELPPAWWGAVACGRLEHLWRRGAP